MIKTFELFQSSPSNSILKLKLGEIGGMAYKDKAHELKLKRALDISYEDDEEDEVVDKEEGEKSIKDLVSDKGKEYPKKASVKKTDQAYPQFNYIVNFTDFNFDTQV